MKRSALLFFILAAACSDDPMRLPSPPGGSSITPPPRVSVSHGSAMPFAQVIGDFAFIDDNRALVATSRGLSTLELKGPRAGMPFENFQEWVLTSSTGFGAAASAIAVPPSDRVGDRKFAFFLPNGSPQAGIVEIEMGGSQGIVQTEAVLRQPLISPFPSSMIAGAEGLWIVDGVFGPGSSVRYYPYNTLAGQPFLIDEQLDRRFTPMFGDVNADQVEDFGALGKISLANDGRVGLVSFSFLAPAPAGAAGGVLAFDTTTGQELGRLILPVTATSSTALEFVGAVGATSSHVVLISAHKSPAFTDLGGTVAIYGVESWAPFKVRDADPATPFDQPQSAVATTHANPVGLALRDHVALVVNAPFLGEGSLDVIAIVPDAKVDSNVPLGALYVNGFAVPGDPKLTRDKSAAFIPAEVGLLRVEFAN